MAKKSKVEFNVQVHGEQLHDFIKQASDHKAIAEGATDAIKEIRTRAREELGVEPKDFNDMFKLYHKDQREEFENKSEEIIEMYDAIFTK